MCLVDGAAGSAGDGQRGVELSLVELSDGGLTKTAHADADARADADSPATLSSRQLSQSRRHGPAWSRVSRRSEHPATTKTIAHRTEGRQAVRW